MSPTDRPCQRDVGRQLRLWPDVPLRHRPILRVRVDDVELDAIETRIRAHPDPSLHHLEHEIALPLDIGDVGPVLVAEHRAERLADQAPATPAVERNEPPVVGTVRLDRTRVDVADGPGSHRVDRAGRPRARRDAVDLVQIDVEHIRSDAALTLEGVGTEVHVDPPRLGEPHAGLELVLPAAADRRCPVRNGGIGCARRRRRRRSGRHPGRSRGNAGRTRARHEDHHQRTDAERSRRDLVPTIVRDGPHGTSTTFV